MTARDAESVRARAEASFLKKEESRAAARTVMAEIASKKDAEQAKTARLRALRLAREAEQALVVPAPKKASGKRK